MREIVEVVREFVLQERSHERVVEQICVSKELESEAARAAAVGAGTASVHGKLRRDARAARVSATSGAADQENLLHASRLHGFLALAQLQSGRLE